MYHKIHWLLLFLFPTPNNDTFFPFRFCLAHPQLSAVGNIYIMVHILVSQQLVQPMIFTLYKNLREMQCSRVGLYYIYLAN